MCNHVIYVWILDTKL
jgi:hypothetical protein